MSKYTTFDSEPKRRISKLSKILNTRRDDDQRYCITKMPQLYSAISPYSKILEFNDRTKVICQKTDLSMFLDTCKIIFVGDANTGKSSLINRFTSNTFDHNYQPTLGVDYQTKFFDVLNVDYNCGFWDSPGSERFKWILEPYYQNANVVVVLFDLTRPSTLINATRWMEDALSANEKSNPLRFLVGTKSDLLPKRTLENIEVKSNLVAQELDAEYFSISSRDGTEVSNLFKRFISLAFENSVQKLIRPPDYNLVRNNLKRKSICDPQPEISLIFDFHAS